MNSARMPDTPISVMLKCNDYALEKCIGELAKLLAGVSCSDILSTIGPCQSGSLLAVWIMWTTAPSARCLVASMIILPASCR